MKVEVEPEDVERLNADDRGRVTLGADLAGKEITVAVVDVKEEQ